MRLRTRVPMPDILAKIPNYINWRNTHICRLEPPTHHVIELLDYWYLTRTRRSSSGSAASVSQSHKASNLNCRFTPLSCAVLGIKLADILGTVSLWTTE
jgi:hypothetical protein